MLEDKKYDSYETARRELLEQMQIDMLMATASIISGFKESVDFLVSNLTQQYNIKDYTPTLKVEMTKILTNLLVNKAENIKMPELDIDQIMSKIDSITKDNI